MLGEALFTNPILQVTLIPAAVTALLALCLPTTLIWLRPLGLSAALFISWSLIVGLPSVPAIGSSQKLVSLAACLWLLPLLLQTTAAYGQGALRFALAVTVVSYLAWPVFSDNSGLLSGLLLFGVGLLGGRGLQIPATLSRLCWLPYLIFSLVLCVSAMQAGAASSASLTLVLLTVLATSLLAQRLGLTDAAWSRNVLIACIWLQLGLLTQLALYTSASLLTLVALAGILISTQVRSTTALSWSPTWLLASCSLLAASLLLPGV